MSLTMLVGLLGALVGFLLGVVARDIYDLLRSVKCKPREAAMPYRRAVCWLRNNSLILLVILFAASQVALAVLLIQQRAASTDYTRCTANWQTQFMASYQARVDVAKDVSTSMDRLIQAVASQDRDEFQAALTNYLNVRRDQRAAQAANPLPEPPQKVCGVSGR